MHGIEQGTVWSLVVVVWWCVWRYSYLHPAVASVGTIRRHSSRRGYWKESGPVHDVLTQVEAELTLEQRLDRFGRELDTWERQGFKSTHVALNMVEIDLADFTAQVFGRYAVTHSFPELLEVPLLPAAVVGWEQLQLALYQLSAERNEDVATV